MINDTLHFLSRELNTHLQNESNLSEDLVVVSPIVNADGSTIGAIKKKLVITLVNIGSPGSFLNGDLPGRGTGDPAPSVLLNILLSANFDTHLYGQGLQLLSAAMLFLQQHPLFHIPNQQQDGKSTRFTVEMNNVTADATNQIWTGLGARYLPSINYTIRTVL